MHAQHRQLWVGCVLNHEGNPVRNVYSENGVTIV